jgi:hypothetical protein
LQKSNYQISTNYGVLIDYPIITENNSFKFKYRIETPKAKGYELNEDGSQTYKTETYTTLAEDNGEINGIKFRIEKDHWGMWKYLVYNELTDSYSISDLSIFNFEHPIILFEVTPYLESNEGTTFFPTETIAVTRKSIVDNPALTAE